MTVEPQHYFVDALTGADGTAAARTRTSLPQVFPDATAVLAPATSSKRPSSSHSGYSLTEGPSSSRPGRQQPYTPPGPLTPSRSMPGQVPTSVSPDLPYNPWPLAVAMDVAATPAPPSAIPAAPPAAPIQPVRRPQGQQSNAAGNPGQVGYGRRINQEAARHRPPVSQPPAAANSAHQIPAAMMAWLPPSIAAQIPQANRPPIAPGSVQPWQQPVAPQQFQVGQQPIFTAPAQPNFRQQQGSRQLGFQQQIAPRQPTRRTGQQSNKKSGGAGAFVVIVFLVLIFTGLGREIIDAIIDAFNK